MLLGIEVGFTTKGKRIWKKKPVTYHSRRRYVCEAIQEGWQISVVLPWTKETVYIGMIRKEKPFQGLFRNSICQNQHYFSK